MIGMSSVSVSSIRNGKDGGTGVGVDESYVEYSYGGSSTVPPGNFLLDENGNYLIDENGEYLMDGMWYTSIPQVPAGLYLWSRTVTKYTDGRESYMYSVGKEGNSILKETRQFYLSNSYTKLDGGYWMTEDDVVYPIPEGKYLWGRFEFVMSNGEIHYSNACYQKTLNGIISDVDNTKLQITNKVWQNDIETQINDYDQNTVLAMRDRQTTMQQSLNGIWTSISDQTATTVIDPDGNEVATLTAQINTINETAEGHTQQIEEMDETLGSTKSIAEQTADRMTWIVASGTSRSDFTLTDEAATLTANYINAKGLVTFNGLNTELQNKINGIESSIDGLNTDITNNAIDILKAWTGNAQLQSTVINGGYIGSHTIVADHLATNAIMSFGKQNTQTGQYTGGYSRDKDSTFSSVGSYFDMENGNIFTPSFSVINTIPTGESLTTGGFFKGNVVAQTGNIGGWAIDGNYLYSVSKTPGSGSMILTPTGATSSTSIGGSSGSKAWALTIKDKFGVTTDGYLYATNADISGKITSSQGSIGGININNIGIYTGSKSAAASTQDGFLISNTGAIYLGAYNSTRNSTAFQVNPNGYVKAYNIDALGGSVGGWKITDSMLYYNSNSSATSPTTPSTSAIILSPLGNSSTVKVGDSTGTQNWAITAGTGFGVTTTGVLWCKGANVSGTINATAGMIGDCEIINGHLNVASASIDEIDGSKITAGTISADRISISNLGDLSSALGSITSGSMGWYSGSGSSYTAFGVDANGKLTATSAVISGTLTAGTGSKIGPWVISATSISKNGTDTAGSDYQAPGTGNMYFGDKGISISNVFYADSSGNAGITGSITATSGRIGNWIIDTNGYLKNSDGSVFISSGLVDDAMYAQFGSLQIQDNGNLYTGSYLAMKYYEVNTSYQNYAQIIAARSPNDLNIVVKGGDGDRVVNGNQQTWFQYGSYSGACIAMAAGSHSNNIYVRTGDNWYNLTTCLDAALSGGSGSGTSYSFNSSEFTVSNNTVSLKNSYALSTHTHSGYAASNHTHSQYLTSSDAVEYDGSFTNGGSGQTGTYSLTSGKEYLVLVHRPSSNDSSGAYLVRGGNTNIATIKAGSNLTVSQSGTTLSVRDSAGNGTIYVLKLN